MSWLSRVFRGDARAPRDVDAALRAALLAVLDRDYGEAEKMLLAAVRLDSDAVEPYLALAHLLADFDLDRVEVQEGRHQAVAVVDHQGAAGEVHVGVGVGDQAELFAHAVFGNHAPGDIGSPL